MRMKERGERIKMVTYTSSSQSEVDDSRRFGRLFRIISCLTGWNRRIFGAKIRLFPPSLLRFLGVLGIDVN